MIYRAIQFIKFWLFLLIEGTIQIKHFDPNDDNDSLVYGRINIQYLGVVNEHGLPMPAHKYTLTFQRTPDSKMIARNLYNFDQSRFNKDLRLALTKMREDIRVYYKLGRF